MKKIAKHIRLLVALLLCSRIAMAAEPTILLLNSDQSVDKYKIAQENFMAELGRPLRSLDLANPRQAAVAEEVVSGESIDLIYCIGSKAYEVAHRNAPMARIVFSTIINWRRLPVRENAYGISNELHPLMQLTLFRYIFPDVKKIGVLYAEKFNQEWYDQTREEARNVGIDLVGRAITDKKEAADELKKILSEVEAYWLISDPVIISSEKTLFHLLQICDGKQVPIFTYNEVFAKYGAALIVSVDDPTVGRQAAAIAESLLAGAKIQGRVQLPAGSRIVLNLKKVRKYGLRYSQDALGNVNRIIE